MRPEPGKDDGHSASDRLARLEAALLAQEQDGPLIARLEVRDVRALNINVGEIALGALDRDANQAAARPDL
jgi:hypothetical protein